MKALNYLLLLINRKSFEKTETVSEFFSNYKTVSQRSSVEFIHLDKFIKLVKLLINFIKSFQLAKTIKENCKLKNKKFNHLSKLNLQL